MSSAPLQHGGPPAPPRRPTSVTVSVIALGFAAAQVALLGLIGLALLTRGTQVQGLPPAVVVPACALLTAGFVVALLRLRAGARSGWTLGLVLLPVLAVAQVWDATSSGSRLPTGLVWPVLGIVALLWPTTRAYVGPGRPAP